MPGGLVIAHGDDAIVFPDPKVAAVAEKLVGEVDGSRTASELDAALPAAARPLMAALLAQMAEKEMLVEAPRGLVPDDMVQSATGQLAMMLGGDWESGLQRWAGCKIGVYGPDADGVATIAAAIRDAGGCVDRTGKDDRVEITLGATTLAAVDGDAGTIIATASDMDSERGDAPVIAGLLGAGGARRTAEQRAIVVATLVRRALLEVLAPDLASGIVTVIDEGGLTREFRLDPGAAFGAVSLESPKALADTATWLDTASPLSPGADVEPAFPLAHRRVEQINPRTGAMDIFVEWGLTPKQADERALAGAAKQWGSTPVEMPTVALEDLRGDAARLWRIAELYAATKPCVGAAKIGEDWQASAELGPATGIGLESDRDLAVARAIGNALSMVQTGRSAVGDGAQ